MKKKFILEYFSKFIYCYLHINQQNLHILFPPPKKNPSMFVLYLKKKHISTWFTSLHSLCHSITAKMKFLLLTRLQYSALNMNIEFWEILSSKWIKCNIGYLLICGFPIHWFDLAQPQKRRTLCETLLLIKLKKNIF